MGNGDRTNFVRKIVDAHNRLDEHAKVLEGHNKTMTGHSKTIKEIGDEVAAHRKTISDSIDEAFLTAARLANIERAIAYLNRPSWWVKLWRKFTIVRK